MDDTLIKTLAEARAMKEGIKDVMKEMVKTVTSSTDYKDLELELQKACQAEADAVMEVQNVAFAEFQKTGNKQPHPNVTIKQFVDIIIEDETGAREWCFENFRPALVLDNKVFERAAKQHGTIPERLFREALSWQAQISRDLSKFLEAKDGVT